METLQLYVKPTSNYSPGLALQTFERLGPGWTGESVILPFGEGPEVRDLEVVGWTDLHLGTACPVHVVRVRHQSGADTVIPEPGILVYGGNSGVRILDPEAEPVAGLDEHLPPGHGRPFVWVEDPADLPAEVLAVVGSLDQDPQQPGAVFALGELAERVIGGNTAAMAKLLNDAGLFPRAGESRPDPSQEVTRETVINLAAQRSGDRVGRVLAGLLSETMEGNDGD